MHYLEPLLLGLAAAAFWGTGDFLVNGLSRRLGVTAALFQSHAIALILIGGIAIAVGQALPAAAPAQWAAVAGGAVLNLVMIAALYRALELGPLPIVAPIVGSYAGIAALLTILSGADAVTLRSGLCLATIFAGVLLAAVEPADANRSGTRSGVGWALLCAGAGGANSWLQGVSIVPAIGAFWTLLINATVVTAATLLAARARRQTLHTDRPSLAMLGLGACISFGFLSYFKGLETGSLILVNVLSSMCSAVTALLGAALLGHHVGKAQWAGAALILGGIVTLNV